MGYKKRELGAGLANSMAEGKETRRWRVMEGESIEDGTRALSRKIMSVLSQVESRDEDERTRYEITGIKGRVKSCARTGQRNRNITIGINPVPRLVPLHHLLRCILSVYHRFFHPLRISVKINRRCAIKILYENCFRPKTPGQPRVTEIITRYWKMLALSWGGFCRAISSRL